MSFVRMSVADQAGPQIAARIAGLKTADKQVKQMADNFSTAVQAWAPRDTDWMVSTASEVTKTASGYAVGPFDKLGRPRTRSPKNTIRQFLEDYPQYAYGMGKTKSGKQRVKRRRRAFPGAWHFLSREAKIKLRDLRRAGMYGMDGPSPRYWQAIQEMRVPGNGGQMGGTDFLTAAYETAYITAAYLEKNVFGR